MIHSKLSRFTKVFMVTIAAAAGIPQITHAYSYKRGGFFCSNNPYFLEGDEAMMPICNGAGTISLVWGTQADIAAGAHWSIQELNTAAPEIYMTRGPCTVEEVESNDRSVEWLSYDAVSFGRTLTSVDCGIFGDPKVYSVDVEVNAFQQNQHTDCKTATFTEDGTWVHELGHGYGLAHFDDWLSTMNTSQVDISSCRSNFSMRPSSDMQQGLDNHYRHGLPAAVDVGGSAVIQPAGCVLSSGGCAMSPGTTTFLAFHWFFATVRFTAMNMRDAYPEASIPFEVWLSSDDVLDGSDVWIGGWSQGGMSFAGAIYPLEVNFWVHPSWLAAAGVRYCALVRFDPGNTVAEFDESDNIVDTAFCFQR